jgi:hypothetical protein
MKRYLWMWGVMAVCIVLSLSCSWFQPDPETAQKHPWLVQPVQPETKTFFCEKLDLEADHSVCEPDKNVLASDLLRVLQQQFPEEETLYSEVEQVLEGYPVEAEESKTPDGTVTSRRYVYLLTEFDGFCVYFYTDLQTGMVTRIGSSSVGSGPSRSVCGSSDLRAQPKPFLSTSPPQSTSTPASP